MSRKKSKPQSAAGKPANPTGPNRPSARASAPAQITQHTPRRPAGIEPAESTAPQRITVSGRWIAIALSGTLVAAVLCAWCALCLLFWQGSWQLLYHPSSTLARTPAGLPFSPIAFDSATSGTPQLNGWWIPAAADAHYSRYTVLYLHGQDGNLGDTTDHLAQLHAAGVNLFAFDYRGYGQSKFEHPGEARWHEDAETALQYLTATRHIEPGAILLDGSNLGADLALEIAAAHPDLAGVVLESPIEDPMSVIFNDARANLVPAHMLVHDRWDLAAPAASLRIPSLWFLPFPKADATGPAANPDIFQKVAARKMFVWLPPGKTSTKNYSDELSRWLDDLQAH